jgi:hypothetical protein
VIRTLTIFILVTFSLYAVPVSTSKKTMQLDWRFNEFRNRGIVPEKVFRIKCIRDTLYYAWPEENVGLPVLGVSGVIKCKDIY